MPTLSVRGIASFLIMIIFVMIGIFAVKWAAKKWNIPVVSAVADAV